MKLTMLIDLVNDKLAGEMLSYKDLTPFLDNVIDDINTQFNSKFPAFSELESFTTDYDAIPDKYIRSVVVPGAAWYFYVMDEEGTPTAQQYQNDYNRGLFFMLRDFIEQIPEEYQCESLQGSFRIPYYDTIGKPGLIVPNYEGEW